MNDWRARLRLAVERSHMKHGVIAADAGICAETLSRILHAKHAHPQFETVARIAQAVRVPVGWILEEPVHGSQLSLDEVDMLRRALRVLDKIIAARK